MVLGELPPGLYLWLGTQRPRPEGTTSPLPPLPLLHAQSRAQLVIHMALTQHQAVGRCTARGRSFRKPSTPEGSRCSTHRRLIQYRLPCRSGRLAEGVHLCCPPP